jgi:hypothetical protein
VIPCCDCTGLLCDSDPFKDPRFGNCQVINQNLEKKLRPRLEALVSDDVMICTSVIMELSSSITSCLETIDMILVSIAGCFIECDRTCGNNDCLMQCCCISMYFSVKAALTPGYIIPNLCLCCAYCAIMKKERELQEIKKNSTSFSAAPATLEMEERNKKSSQKLDNEVDQNEQQQSTASQNSNTLDDNPVESIEAIKKSIASPTTNRSTSSAASSECVSGEAEFRFSDSLERKILERHGEAALKAAADGISRLSFTQQRRGTKI